MAPARETIWNAEANRWNIGKLIVGVMFATYAARLMLALAILVGAANFPNAHPDIQANPLGVALWSAALALLFGLAFNWLERERRRCLAG